MNSNTSYKYPDVRFISPIRKLGKVKLSYSQMKKLSISIVMKYIENNVIYGKEILNKIRQYNKKDDITDSMLYILVHIGVIKN
jgi:hypothetical protein